MQLGGGKPSLAGRASNWNNSTTACIRTLQDSWRMHLSVITSRRRIAPFRMHVGYPLGPPANSTS